MVWVVMVQRNQLVLVCEFTVVKTAEAMQANQNEKACLLRIVSLTFRLQYRNDSQVTLVRTTQTRQSANATSESPPFFDIDFPGTEA